MIIELPYEFSDSYFDEKLNYAALSKAVKMAREKDASNEQIDCLLNRKKSVEEHIEEMNRWAAKATVSIGANIGRLSKLNGWYIIFWYGYKQKLQSSMEPLLESEIWRLERDLPKQKMLVQSDMENSLPMTKDFELYENFNNTVLSRAETILKTLLDEENGNAEIKEEAEEEQPCGEPQSELDRVTNHAVNRWIQRILEIKEGDDCIKYRNENFDAVRVQVLNAFNESELVYEADSAQFYLHKRKSIFFVYKESHIVTVYVNDFGFSPAINKKITMEQLKLVQKMNRNFGKNKESLLARVDSIAAEMEEIENRIARDKQVYKELEALKEDIFAGIRKAKLELEEEEKKLFTEFKRGAGQ